MKKQLKDICETITKGTTPTTLGYNYQETGINFVKIESINGYGMFEPEKFAHISDDCNIALRRSQLKENDILFSIAGAIGRTAIVNKSILPANTNQALAIIRLNNSEEYNLKFLRYQLASEVVLRQTERQKQGVAQLNLSLKDIGNLELSLPSLSDQQRIATELDTIQSAIDNKKQQLSLLDEAVKSEFVEMFGEPHDNKTFPYKLVGEFTTVTSGGTPDRKKTEYWKNGTIPWVKTTELQNNEITEIEEFITQKGLDESSAKIVPAGTLLIAMYGQGKTRGMTGYLGIEASTNQACACILPSTQINQKFLWYYFILSYDKLRDLAKGGNQPNLNGNMIKSFPVLWPPLELQNEYVRFVQQIDKSKFVVKQQIADLQELLDSKMQEYFS